MRETVDVPYLLVNRRSETELKDLMLIHCRLQHHKKNLAGHMFAHNSNKNQLPKR
jgi:hypothetical protein